MKREDRRQETKLSVDINMVFISVKERELDEGLKYKRGVWRAVFMV